MFVFTTTALAAPTATFYGGYKFYGDSVHNTIEIELTNISSQEKVIISEAKALEYFDDPEMLNWVMD